MEYQIKHSSPQRRVRHAVLNGERPAPSDIALLESFGIDTNALQARLIQSKEHTH